MQFDINQMQGYIVRNTLIICGLYFNRAHSMHMYIECASFYLNILDGRAFEGVKEKIKTSIEPLNYKLLRG